MNPTVAAKILLPFIGLLLGFTAWLWLCNPGQQSAEITATQLFMQSLAHHGLQPDEASAQLAELQARNTFRLPVKFSMGGPFPKL